MKKLTPLLVLPLLLGGPACRSLTAPPAQPPPTAGQTAQKFLVTQTRTLSADYLRFLPAGYDASSGKRWPLIFFLHGAGERGSDVWKVTAHGPPKIDTTETNFPFIVVSPQCPDGKIWSDDLLLALLDNVETNYAVDTHRVYLTGLSMGGFGTWSLGLRHPERFAAIAPIAGGGNFITPYGVDQSELKRLPIWAFHGGQDPVVPVEETKRMVSLMKKIGVKEVKFTLYPDAQHDCWTQTYTNKELFTWFLQHSR